LKRLLPSTRAARARVAGVALAMVVVASAASAASSSISLVSASKNGAPGNNNSDSPAWSPDGQSIAFASYASNLVDSDRNGTWDIFVKNLHSGAVRLVSSSPAGVHGNDRSFSGPAWSPDGSLIAFYSDATNLGGAVPARSDSLFIKNLRNNSVSHIAVVYRGFTSIEAPSWSPDGKMLAFAGTRGQVFVVNLRTRRTMLVSATPGGGEAHGLSSSPIWSPDGRRIAFFSYASDIVSGDGNGTWDLFVRDLKTNTTTVVDATATGQMADKGAGGGASWSPDGKRIAFESNATNLVAGHSEPLESVYAKNLTTGAITLLSKTRSGRLLGESGQPAWNPDGNRVAFCSKTTGGSWTLYVKNLGSGALGQFSATGTDCSQAAWDRTGKRLAFEIVDSRALRGAADHSSQIAVK
jgi:Tol biopolymer transport system component